MNRLSGERVFLEKPQLDAIVNAFKSGKPIKLHFSPAQLRDGSHPIYLNKKEHKKLVNAKIAGRGCDCNLSKNSLKRMIQEGQGLFMFGDSGNGPQSRTPPTEVIKGTGLPDKKEITTMRFDRPMGFMTMKPPTREVLKQPPVVSGDGLAMFGQNGSGLQMFGGGQSYGAIPSKFMYDY